MKKNRVNEVHTTKDGFKFKIIAYRSSKDIDIQYEDGEIKKTSYDTVSKGFNRFGVYSKLEDRTGEEGISNKGQKMKIIAYRNARDIDIMFEDNTIVLHKAYNSFKRGTISNPNYKGVSHDNEERIMNNGSLARIVCYRNSNDIDVLLDNSVLVEHRQYSSFMKGSITNERVKDKYLNTETITNQGFHVKVVECDDSQNIKVKFDDGSISKVTSYQFNRGEIGYPTLNRKRRGVVKNFNVIHEVARADKTVYYECVCQKCGYKDILTPLEIFGHKCTFLEDL